MIIAIGFKVNNDRAVRFRKWSGQIIKDYTIQGWTMDKERLKKGHMFTDEYFERQLQNIREIRLSERKFYQKITDLYSTAFDYDKDAKTTRRFFQTVQNKMHWAVHRHTAAELIVERADAEKEHMGLTTWEAVPDGKIVKADASIEKNYLNDKEMSYMERIVSLYLEYAELQAERRIPMSKWIEGDDFSFTVANNLGIGISPQKQVGHQGFTKNKRGHFRIGFVVKQKI